MSNIRNVKQLKAEQQRLNRQQKELEQIIGSKWKDILYGLSPSAIISGQAAGILQKLIKKGFPLK